MILSGKAATYNSEIRTAFPLAADRRVARQRIDGFLVTQLLCGFHDGNRPGIAWLIRAAALMTTVALPIVLLLFVQLSFLPYHDPMLTWFHRGCVVAGLSLIVGFWPPIMTPAGFEGGIGGARLRDLWPKVRQQEAGETGTNSDPTPLDSPSAGRTAGQGGAWTGLRILGHVFAAGRRAVLRLIRRFLPFLVWSGRETDREAIGRLAAVAISLFAILIATYPGEWIDDNLARRLADHVRLPNRSLALVPASEALFEGRVDLVRGGTQSWFANRLVLPDVDIVDETRDNFDTQAVSRSLRGRDFRNAIFMHGDFRKVDFTGADLSNAVLARGRFDNARFGCDSMDGAEANYIPGLLLSMHMSPHLLGLTCTNLAHAIMPLAELREADLRGAQLFDAWLAGAELQEASLDWADLQGATVSLAFFQGASLYGAKLQGAFLKRAHLEASDLTGAVLHGAVLAETHLEGAKLHNAQLQGGDLARAQMQGADLSDVQLQGANLVAAEFRGVNLKGAYVWRARGRSSPNATTQQPAADALHDLDACAQWRSSADPSGSSASVEGLAPDVAAKVTGAWLERVRAGSLRNGVAKRLAPLTKPADPDLATEEAAAPFEKSLGPSLSEKQYHRVAVDEILRAACKSSGAPYVARGILAYRTPGEFGDQAARIVAAFRDAESCAGAEGLIEGDWDYSDWTDIELPASTSAPGQAAAP
ncbi:pentapeptide repeat-containing protein [Consotaella aegiceratis]|uniref:pentapeptide repeat-containing protein n=1 Tax=Consotaella aegiceratis TaxID=3097961 RepID=UPI002F40BFC7